MRQVRRMQPQQRSVRSHGNNPQPCSGEAHRSIITCSVEGTKRARCQAHAQYGRRARKRWACSHSLLLLFACFQALLILDELIAMNLSSGGLSSNGIQQTVILTAGLATMSLQVDNATVASEIRSRLLQVMDGLVEGAGSVVLGHAEALVSSVNLLANSSSGLTGAQQELALSVLQRTTQAVDATSQGLQGDTIMALSALVGAGVLEQEGCHEKRADVKVDSVMSSLAGLAVGSLTGADQGYSYEDQNLGTHAHSFIGLPGLTHETSVTWEVFVMGSET